VPLLLLGVGFWLLPGIIVTASSKYQKELVWGLGYLPVYVSGFGVMMLALGGILAAYRQVSRLKGRAWYAVVISTAVAGSVICGINYNDNRMVIQRYNLAEHYPRRIVESALQSRLMATVPPGSFLLCDRPVRSWDSPAFFRMHSGTTVQVVKPSGFSPDAQLGNLKVTQAFTEYERRGTELIYDFTRKRDTGRAFIGYAVHFKGEQGPVLERVVASTPGSVKRRAFFLKYHAQFKELGYAVLGRVRFLKADDAEIFGVSADKVRIYVGVPTGYPCSEVCVTGCWTDRKSVESAGMFRLNERDLLLISSDAHGRLYEIPHSAMRGNIDPRSVTVNVTSF
jgi:hypothetical protein